MTREEWLALRREAIGGSDMGAILGLSPYASAYTVFMDKTGRTVERPTTEAMRQGTDLEEYVAWRFVERSGKTVRRLNALVRNSDYPYAHANVDRLIVGEKAGLECKTTSVLSEKRFRCGRFPDEYYAQCAHYMAIMEYHRWYLAVLVLNRDFLVYQLTRVEGDSCPTWCESSVYVSAEDFAGLRSAQEQFWALVESETPPAMTGAPRETAYLNAISAEDNQEIVDLTLLAGHLNQIQKLKQQRKDNERQLAAHENEVKAAMHEHQFGTAPGLAVSWKPQSREYFDVERFAKEHPEMDLSAYYKTTEFRVLRMKEARAS